VKKEYGMVLAVVAGITVGSFGTQILKAQKSPPAFIVAEVDVNNPDQFKTYAAGVPATMDKYAGHYLVRGGKTESLEGEAPKRIIVSEFKSMADAKKWYDSPEYSAIRPIRQHSAKSRLFIVEGAGE
jgi:uncharacterized protein (DUF1330 family)